MPKAVIRNVQQFGGRLLGLDVDGRPEVQATGVLEVDLVVGRVRGAFTTAVHCPGRKDAILFEGHVFLLGGDSTDALSLSRRRYCSVTRREARRCETSESAAYGLGGIIDFLVSP
jgi:hypothetical protein